MIIIHNNHKKCCGNTAVEVLSYAFSNSVWNGDSIIQTVIQKMAKLVA